MTNKNNPKDWFEGLMTPPQGSPKVILLKACFQKQQLQTKQPFYLLTHLIK